MTIYIYKRFEKSVDLLKRCTGIKLLRTVTFIFNQFLHVTFSHAFAVSFVQDKPWFCGFILIHLFYIKLLVYGFWRFETITYNKQGSIEDTSFSFLYDFMTQMTIMGWFSFKPEYLSGSIFTTAELWNSIDEDIKLSSLSLFKKKVKQQFIKDY